MSTVEERDLILRCYVDASWGSKKRHGSQEHQWRLHLSWSFLLEGLDKPPAAAQNRKLYALVEGAKEALGSVMLLDGWNCSNLGYIATARLRAPLARPIA